LIPARIVGRQRGQRGEVGGIPRAALPSGDDGREHEQRDADEQTRGVYAGLDRDERERAEQREAQRKAARRARLLGKGVVREAEQGAEVRVWSAAPSKRLSANFGVARTNPARSAAAVNPACQASTRLSRIGSFSSLASVTADFVCLRLAERGWPSLPRSLFL
jgi:hypothetical protein